ncbi:expressed unknown protein [Seminavis robusta]|uniref:Potassium channel domain-containing protein n=1 Tax=Seminavis robusta TaxID=568900 RepID=A0A9N8HQW5_9STRA|nr:expressed unknown protein [Seminavis robusta]|eukprot:Sro1200_g251920.1 n/a (530) ;mRNA; r:26327-27992
MVILFQRFGEHEDEDGHSQRSEDSAASPITSRNQKSNVSSEKISTAKAPEEAFHDDVHHETAAYRELLASTHWVHKLQCSVPRLYFIATQLIFPLLILIGMSFLFGYGLATMEKGGEIEANDKAVKDNLMKYLTHIDDRISIWLAMKYSASQCFANLTDVHENVTVLEQSFPDVNFTDELGGCGFFQGLEQFDVMEPIDFFALAGSELSLTFNWMECAHSVENTDTSSVNYTDETFERLELNQEDAHDREFLAYAINYMEQFFEAASDVEDPFGDKDALRKATQGITGSHGCKVHAAAGALFWFTIMTTIGYGNTAPTTDEGRLLVYTCGFVTIIGFLALNNSASNVWKILVDDLFLRLKLKRLVKGPLSVLFWLCTTILWMLVLALAMQKYRRNRLAEDFSLKDAFWFSYITTTTVGFGDIHISHEEFKVGDMFFIPLIVLMGFNFLGIFAEKLVDLYNEYFPSGTAGFGTILAAQRGDIPHHNHHHHHHDNSRQQRGTGDTGMERPYQYHVWNGMALNMEFEAEAAC